MIQIIWLIFYALENQLSYDSYDMSQLIISELDNFLRNILGPHI